MALKEAETPLKGKKNYLCASLILEMLVRSANNEIEGIGKESVVTSVASISPRFEPHRIRKHKRLNRLAVSVT